MSNIYTYFFFQFYNSHGRADVSKKIGIDIKFISDLYVSGKPVFFYTPDGTPPHVHPPPTNMEHVSVGSHRQSEKQNKQRSEQRATGRLLLCSFLRHLDGPIFLGAIQI